MTSVKTQNETIFVGSLYRFGYDLTTAGFNEKRVKDALMREYKETYFKWNGCKPSAEEVRNAREDIEIIEHAPYNVQWR